MYIKQPLKDAVDEVLEILGLPSNEWKDREYAKRVKRDEKTAGMQYEMDESIYILRAALGQPVPRLRCKVCEARDAIYWESEPKDPSKAPKGQPRKQALVSSMRDA